MLYLSRVTRSEMHMEAVDLSRMAGQVAESLRDAAPERGVELAIEEGIVVQADAKLMRIVLENLLGNAWKFTGKQPQARIEFGVAVQSGINVIFVRDNGAGFNMEYAHKLFAPFQRLHGVSDFEGTGIGLATVQRIIRRHGGHIWAEAKEGQGATFFFSCVHGVEEGAQ
ncbi:MAG: ATP-binding protein, partial [Sulfurimicrobium sp.]|nr:ATP-binding protein [Sulfurimicrobium sp.]